MISKKLIYLFLIYQTSIFACTTLVITKGATTDGSVIVAHTEDNELADQRVIFVPSNNYKTGEKRAITPISHGFPRFNGKGRAPAYYLKKYPSTEITGYIDQVAHTYSYLDGNYAIINEHQLAIGECTDISYYEYKPDKNMIFDISELSRIALERCKRAKEAVITVGELAEKYGYFNSAETLIFADTEEAWVFEISASPEKKGALWVAKKVPDGEAFVAANEFRIRDISSKDCDILHSKDLFEIAAKEKWFNPEKESSFDWLKSVSPGEYNHPYYSLRRIWRMQTKINPSLKISPWVEDGYTKEYPFSIKPEKKLSLHDVMMLFRDHYEDTEFDLTKGLAAGPFGCPTRYIGPYDPTLNLPDEPQKKIEGAWERPISMFYTGYVYINQLRDYLPDPIGGVSWIGYDDPYTTCYIPFYVGINELPESFEMGSPQKFDNKIAFWVFNFVSNWATLKHSYMIEDIKKAQQELEMEQILEQEKIEKKALKLYDKNHRKASKYLTHYCKDNCEKILQKWRELSNYLIEKYVDGYINKPKPHIEVGYPQWWLNKVDYAEGPTSYSKKEK